MTNSPIRVASSLILLLILGLGSDFSHVRAASDERQIVIDKIETDTMTPEKIGRPRGASGASRDTKWTLVEFSYNVYPDPNSKEKVNYVDEITFKVSVEGRVQEGDARDAQTAVLTGEVTYMTVPLGKGYGSFYISPDAVARYRIGQFNINVQALIGGQVVDTKDKKKEKEEDANWFTRSDYKILPGLLLNKNQSPFILNDTDRYPVIKPKQ